MGFSCIGPANALLPEDALGRLGKTMNARLSRISTTSVLATSGTVLAGALAIMLTGGLAFADNGSAPSFESDSDLPLEAPKLQSPTPPKAPAPIQSPAPVDSTPPPVFFGKDIQNTGSVVYVIDQA